MPNAKFLSSLIIPFLFFSYPTFADVSVRTIGATTPAPVPDSTINANALSAISKDKNLFGLNVGISSQNGVVSLSGTVKTMADAEDMVAVVQSIPGVRDIDASQLTIEGNQRLPIELLLKQKIIGRLVQAKAFGDKDIYNIPIDVKVNNGIVYLSGTVDSTAQMIYIIKIAQSTSGVGRVISELTVKVVNVHITP